MEYRFLGASGLQVPVLCFGTATFGGEGFFNTWGATQAEEATRLIDLCIDAGVNFFDTANTYSAGLSETILGKAIKGKRDKVLISTKATFPMGEAPNHQGSSRWHLLRQVEGSLQRLGTDYIDVYHMHGFDGNTAIEETLRTLDDLVTSGKVRYVACSNFSGWHLIKSLATAERYGWNRYVGHQVYYSLLNREYEWELMPLGIDQKVGSIIWSPLSGGRLGGKYGRNKPMPENSRVALGGSPVPEAVVNTEVMYKVTDALEGIAEETGKSVAQVAINWLLQKPTVSSIIFGARDEAQLQQNLGAVGWNLSADQVQQLDEASDQSPIYPYWHQRINTQLNPIPPSRIL